MDLEDMEDEISDIEIGVMDPVHQENRLRSEDNLIKWLSTLRDKFKELPQQKQKMIQNLDRAAEYTIKRGRKSGEIDFNQVYSQLLGGFDSNNSIEDPVPDHELFPDEITSEDMIEEFIGDFEFVGQNGDIKHSLASKYWHSDTKKAYIRDKIIELDDFPFVGETFFMQRVNDISHFHGQLVNLNTIKILQDDSYDVSHDRWLADEDPDELYQETWEDLEEDPAEVPLLDGAEKKETMYRVAKIYETAVWVLAENPQPINPPEKETRDLKNEGEVDSLSREEKLIESYEEQYGGLGEWRQPIQELLEYEKNSHSDTLSRDELEKISTWFREDEYNGSNLSGNVGQLESLGELEFVGSMDYGSSEIEMDRLYRTFEAVKESASRKRRKPAKA